jgi:hypothetical protein
LSEDILNSEILLANFDFIRIDRKSKVKQRGGGLIVYVNHSIKCTNIQMDEIENLDYTWIKIHRKGLDEVTMGVFYRPPDGDEEQIKNLIKKMASFKNSRTVLIGDFNFGDINWKNYTAGSKGKEFLKAIKNLSLHQMVKKKTRGENILDLVLVYEKNLVHRLDMFEPIGKSDHDTLCITLNVKIVKQQKTLNAFNYNKADYRILEEEVDKIDWDDEINKVSVNEYWIKLIGLLNDYKDKFIPKFKNRLNNETPWCNTFIKKMIKKRNNLFKRFKKTGQIYFKIKYKKLRNEVTKQIKILKGKYENKIIKRSKNNRKIFYTYINNNQKRGGNRKIGPLVDKTDSGGKEKIVDDDREVATLLNDYFCTVFNSDENELGQNIYVENNNQMDMLDSISISNEDVVKAISDFKTNKSPGIDSITSTYAIKIKEIVSKPLSLLFNKSLEVNKIPDAWKKANITPIFKKGSRSSAVNYRPVSLTVFFCKVMEKILKQNIDRYLDYKGVEMSTQHGFRKGRSCLTNLLISQHSIMRIIDEKQSVDILYLDFQKAFDKVPHERLMKKVRKYGIGGKIGKWIKNWLQNRLQRVVINGVYSEWREVKSGVPQGSILGPLLFTLYIEDIDKGLKNCLLKFADDTKMWGKVDNDEDILMMQDDLNKLCEWSKENEMPFNVSKCGVMHVGKRNKREIYRINGQILGEVTEEKDLGVVFTEGCKPSVNCDKVSKNANKIMGLIRRKVTNKTKEGMLILYKTLVRPILDYCIPVWRPYMRKDINKLEKVQKRYTKMIKECKGKNYEERINMLGLTSLENRHYRADMIQVFKVLNDNKGIYPSDFLTLAERPGRRNSKKLVKKRSLLEISRQSFTNRVIDPWNDLPDDVVSVKELNEFKNGLDKYMRDVRGREQANA